MNGFGKALRTRLSLLTAIILIAVLLVPASALAAADSFTVSTKFPIDILVFIPCAAGGAGEFVELTGNLHDLFHITFDGSGGVHVSYLDNPQGIKGYGWTTGARYQGTGGTHDHFNSKVGYQETYINNFRMIGQGPGNNFLVHENFHITVNANGTVTAYHDNFSVECK